MVKVKLLFVGERNPELILNSRIYGEGLRQVGASIQFRVDTGSSRTIIMEKDAKARQIKGYKNFEKPSRDEQIVGIGGKAESRVYPIKICLHDEDNKRHEFDIKKSQIQIGKEALELSSLLGIDFFKEHDIGLHFDPSGESYLEIKK